MDKKALSERNVYTKFITLPLQRQGRRSSGNCAKRSRSPQGPRNPARQAARQWEMATGTGKAYTAFQII